MSCVSNQFPLRISTPEQEGVMRTSKWLKHQVLLDAEEMKQLCEALGPFSIFVVSEVVPSEGMQISLQEFLSAYSNYVQLLASGKLPDETMFRKYFSAVFTLSSDLLYAMKVGENRYLIKTIRPVVQLQFHHFARSTVDGKFYPMTQGKDSVTWGIQFSYPQIFQKPKQHSFARVVASEEFPNTILFQRLILWLRRNTLPTCFLDGDKKITVPIRLGKKAFPWISNHPQLVSRGLTVFDNSGRGL